MLSLFEICNAIESGKPVIIPTETVYGLAGRADSPELIQKICQIKQRSITHPLAWLCPKDYNFSKLVSTWPKEARILAGKFWPGPLTMIFPRAKNLKAGQAGQTLGLRVPAHPLTLEILDRLQTPIVATSANLTGNEAPKSIQDISKDIITAAQGNIIDGGPCQLGKESTILDMSQKEYKILREGAIFAEVAEAIGL